MQRGVGVPASDCGWDSDLGGGGHDQHRVGSSRHDRGGMVVWGAEERVGNFVNEEAAGNGNVPRLAGWQHFRCDGVWVRIFFTPAGSS